jgi:hypothetical protein
MACLRARQARARFRRREGNDVSSRVFIGYRRGDSGLDGLSKIPEAPNIAGQVENYLVAQLNAFKAGDRKNEMMSIVAENVSPTGGEDRAAYCSAISVRKLPAR